MTVKKITEADKQKAKLMREGRLPWPVKAPGGKGKAEADKRFGNGSR